MFPLFAPHHTAISPPPYPLSPDEAVVCTVAFLGLLFCLVVLPILAVYRIDNRKDTFIRVEETTLTICRTPFWSWLRGRWICTFYGIPVEIRMSKSIIKDYIEAGVGPKCGDTIRVLLSITQVYDDDRRAYVNQSYKIKEFLELIPAPELPTLPGM